MQEVLQQSPVSPRLQFYFENECVSNMKLLEAIILKRFLILVQDLPLAPQHVKNETDLIAI